MTEYEEMLKRLHSKGKHKVRNTYNMNHAYKYYKENCKNPLSRKEFSNVIHKRNRELIEHFLIYGEVKLPSLGRIVLFKHPMFEKRKDGSMAIHKSIDWKRTHTLWAEDEEALKNKTFVYYISDYKYRIMYDVTRAPYRNHSFYKLFVLRRIKKELAELINNKEVDAIRIL